MGGFCCVWTPSIRHVLNHLAVSVFGLPSHPRFASTVAVWHSCHTRVQTSECVARGSIVVGSCVPLFSFACVWCLDASDKNICVEHESHL